MLTTALFAVHFLVQLPGGRAIDRFGARAIGLASITAVVAGNTIALIDASYWSALAGRTVMGLGTGAGFVAGVDLVRASGGGPLLQGIYGGSTMAGGGLALVAVPLLAGPLDWRAPYLSALALSVVAAAPLLATAPLAAVRHAGPSRAVLSDRGLLALGAIQAATFGLSIVAGNWIVTLLERRGTGSVAAGAAGSLILLGGIVTRPGGGLVLRRHPDATRRLVAASLGLGAVAVVVIAADPPLWLATTAAAVAGLAAGFPFAAVMAGAQRARPDAPAAAVGLTNGVAVLVIVVATPLAGLGFDLPGEGDLVFVTLAALWGAALLAVRRAPL